MKAYIKQLHEQLVIDASNIAGTPWLLRGGYAVAKFCNGAAQGELLCRHVQRALQTISFI